jgi:chromosome segregation ATPase
MAENWIGEEEYARPPLDPRHAEETGSFALAPLVDKIAYGIAKGLVVAMKELENHIATETQKVGDAVDRRMDALQTTMTDVSRFMAEQQSTNQAVQGRLQELSTGLQASNAAHASDVDSIRKQAAESAASTSQRIEAAVAAQKESDSRLAANLSALQEESRTSSRSISERIDGVCKDLTVQQEDVAAVKATLVSFASRVDGIVERLDRQAEAVRSMCAAYSQRESELSQLVDGLARLRAFGTNLTVNSL